MSRHHVTLRLSEEDLSTVDHLRRRMGLATNTATLVQALRLATLLVREARAGKTLAFVDSNQGVCSVLRLPGL